MQRKANGLKLHFDNEHPRKKLTFCLEPADSNITEKVAQQTNADLDKVLSSRSAVVKEENLQNEPAETEDDKTAAQDDLVIQQFEEEVKMRQKAIQQDIYKMDVVRDDNHSRADVQVFFLIISN